MIKRVILTVVIEILLSIASFAQTIKWAIKPNYDKIERYSDDLFKCWKGSTVQLVDLSGKALLDENIKADSITDYDGGYALVLQRQKILGFYSEDKPHRFIEVKGDYYTTKYSFFSEGRLVVSDEPGDKGQQGYLNTEGAVAIRRKYRVAGPFRHGWAPIMEKKKAGYVSLISNDEVTGDRSGEYKFVQTSTFNDSGLAVVIASKGLRSVKKTLVINTSFQCVEMLDHDLDQKLASLINPYDYSYRPKGVSPKERPVNPLPVLDDGIEVFGTSALGFRTSQRHIIAPEQFKTVKPFSGGCAIVSNGDGKFGVIQLVQGNVETQLSPEKIWVYPNNICKKINCEVQTPSAIGDDHVVLRLDNGDGIIREAYLQEGEYGFKPYLDGKNESVTVNMEVSTDDGLMLLQDSQDITLYHIDLTATAPTPTTVFADGNGNQTVKSVITNKSKVTVDAKWTMTVGGHKAASGTCKLKPKATQTITNTVKVESEEENVQATVTVTVNGNKCCSNSAKVTLKKN